MLITCCFLLLAPQAAPTEMVDSWTVRALDAESGRPMAGVTVWGTYELGLQSELEYALAEAVTDEAGVANLDLSALAGLHAIERNVVEMTAVFSGPGIQTDSLSTSLQEVVAGPRDDPEFYAEYVRDLELAPGSCVIGRVVDASGKGVAGANLQAGAFDPQDKAWSAELEGSCYQFLANPEGWFSLDVDTAGPFEVYAWHKDHGAGFLQLDRDAAEAAQNSGLVVVLDSAVKPARTLNEIESTYGFSFPTGFVGVVSEDPASPAGRSQVHLEVTSPEGHPIRGVYVHCSWLRPEKSVGSLERTVALDRIGVRPSPEGYRLASAGKGQRYVASAEIYGANGIWRAEEVFEVSANGAPTRVKLPLQWIPGELSDVKVDFQFLDSLGASIPKWSCFVETAASGLPLFTHTPPSSMPGPCDNPLVGHRAWWRVGLTRLLTHAGPGRFELPVETTADVEAGEPFSLVVRSPGFGGRLAFVSSCESDAPKRELLVRFRSPSGEERQGRLLQEVRLEKMQLTWSIDPVYFTREPTLLLPPGQWNFSVEDEAGEVVHEGTAYLVAHQTTTLELHWASGG